MNPLSPIFAHSATFANFLISPHFPKLVTCLKRDDHLHQAACQTNYHNPQGHLLFLSTNVWMVYFTWKKNHRLYPHLFTVFYESSALLSALTHSHLHDGF